MNKFLKFILALCSTVLSLNSALADEIISTNQPVLVDEYSLIVIYNNSKVANRISLSINESPIAYLKANEYFTIKVVPSYYEVKSDGGTTELKIEAKAGQIHYIQQSVSLFGGRKLGLLPGVKLHLSDQESFSEFTGSVPILYATTDYKQNESTLFYLEGGATYDGEFTNDYPNGKGKVIFPDGESKIGSYEGDVKYGHLTGWGKVIHKNGVIYEGQLERGILQGQGRLTGNNGVADGVFKKVVSMRAQFLITMVN